MTSFALGGGQLRILNLQKKAKNMMKQYLNGYNFAFSLSNKKRMDGMREESKYGSSEHALKIPISLG